MIAAVKTNTPKLIGMCEVNPCSHLFIASHAMGAATVTDKIMSFKKSFASNSTSAVTLAPSTFRTLISFLRCSALNVARPNRPIQEIRIAIAVK